MLTLNYLGYWREQGYYNRPSILDIPSNSHPYNTLLEHKIEHYLSESYCLVKGTTACLITGVPIAGDIMTDGKWVWTKEVLYYYKERGLELPLDFVRTIQQTSSVGMFLKKKFISIFLKNRIKNTYIRQRLAYDFSKILASSTSSNTLYKSIAFFKIDNRNQDHSDLTPMVPLIVHTSKEVSEMVKTAPTTKGIHQYVDYTFSFSATFLYLASIPSDSHILIKVNLLAFSTEILQSMLNQRFCLSQNIGTRESLYEEFAVLTSVKTLP